MQRDEFEVAAPMGTASVTAKSGTTSATVNIYGITGAYFQIMDMELASGRFLKTTDVENHTSVIILSADTAVEFFGRTDVAGERISFDGRSFLVAGVLTEDAASPTGGVAAGFSAASWEDSEESETVVLEGYIPYSTLTRMADNVLDITRFYVSAADETSMDQAEEALTQLLLREEKYNVSYNMDMACPHFAHSF